jgi:Tol biopolymer transport system component
MYVDGIKLYDGQLAANEYNPTVGAQQKFLVQRPWSMLYYSFIGEICNIAAFDGTALSDAEVGQLYTATNPRQYQDRPIVFGSNRSGTNSIWRMNPDGTALTQLTSHPQGDGGPRWSPDGSAIAFVRGTNLMLMSPDGSNQRAVSTFINGYGGIRWAPDGSYLAYAKRTISDWYAPYYRINLDGTGEALFLDQYGKTTILGFHPSGNSVVWAGATGNWEPGAELYTAPISGGIVSPSAATPLTSNSAAENCPSYSPDGSTIMFTRTDNASGYGNPYNIHLVNADGTNDRKLTSYTGSDSARFPVWSPLGNQIIYQRERGGRTCLILRDLTSSSETQLTGSTYDASEADWCMAWTTINSGLIAYYPFDGSAADASGNSNNATLYNTAHYVPGHTGQAVYLTGRGHTGTSGDYVMIPPLSLDTNSQFSISMWVKHDGYAGLFDHGENYIAFHMPCGNSVGIAFSGTPWSFVYYAGNVGIASVSTGAEWGNWVMHTLTWSSGTLRAYKNGTFIGSQQAATNYVQNASEGGLGIHWFCSAGTVSTRFTGGIDDVRIYNRALNAAEVATLAGVSTVDMPLSISTSGNKPVLTWPFGALFSADDLSGPWAPVVDTTSPWTNSATSGRKFYRLRP